MRNTCLSATLLAFSLCAFGCSATGGANASVEAKAARIHTDVLTIDTHVDTPLRLVRSDFDPGQRHDARQRGGKVDFPRMAEGGLDAIFFAVYVGQGPRTPEKHAQSKERALKTFEAIHRALEASSGQAELALTPDDAYRIEKSGKRAIYVGMENGYPIGNDLTLLKRYYDLGARYVTLCHLLNNDICDSSTDEPEHGGLSDLGRDVVAEMNRLGMMVDVSHISDEAFYDVLDISKAPVIASHSCARALCDHPRNLDDAMLRKLAEHDGVIQLCLYSAYLKTPTPSPQRQAALDLWEEKYEHLDDLPEAEQERAREEWRVLQEKYPPRLATVSDAVDHIDHIVRAAGIDHVGIGSDFDGGGEIDGCYDVSEMRNITIELVRRGYTKKQIQKIWGGNVMRVFRRVVQISEEIAS